MRPAPPPVVEVLRGRRHVASIPQGTRVKTILVVRTISGAPDLPVGTLGTVGRFLRVEADEDGEIEVYDFYPDGVRGAYAVTDLHVTRRLR